MLHKATIPFDYYIAEELKPRIADGKITFLVLAKKSYGEEYLTEQLIEAAQSLGLRVKDAIASPDNSYKFEALPGRARAGLFQFVEDTMNFLPVYVVPQGMVKDSYTLAEVGKFEKRMVSIPLDRVIADN